MFFSTGLYFRSPGTNDDKKSLKGKPLCDKLFPVSGGPFLNRDRLYLNLRNDTGYSYNFYRNYEDSSEDSLQIGPDAGNLATKKYGVDGWPIHFEDAVSGNTLCFRLRVDNASPLLFLHQIGSNSPGGKRFTDKSALLDASDLGWTKPIIFTRQSDSAGSRPPWCFVAHYLRGLDGSNVATSPTGVFDTAPLQFGPIGDRVVAAYDELWPASVTTSSPSTKNYERIFVSDKVFRYDGGSKSDPVDSTGAARSLVYDRVGDTYYIFQKGAATATAGQDSVIILQRRQYEGRREFIGSWSALEPVNPLAANQGLFFKLLSGKGLSTPISKTLTVSSGPPVTVLTFDELQNDTAVKKELFDFTFLCVSKAAFDPGITAANGGSSGGEVHTTFLSLITPQLSPGQFSSYDLAWKRWDGQNTVFASTSPSMPVYSADGVFFSSSDFDGGSLSNLASAYTMTTEEGWLSRLWDNVIDKDHQGESASSRMRALVDGFAFAVLEVSTTSSNPEGELAALVESYAPQIWDRAVLLVQDTTSPDSLEWSDRILYCARAKMEVSLKNHVYVLANPATQTRLIKRFEELSRNYAHLDFATAATRKRILVTGFDPFDPTGSGSSTVVNTNPSGKLALYFAQDPDWKSEIPQSHNNDLFIRTCIFPNRYQDFDEGIVESIIGNCIDVARLGNTPINAVCTCSLDPFIKLLITGFKLKDGTILSNLNNFNDVHVRIDRFAGKCRGGSLDNELKSSVVLADATLPDGSDKKVFYETKFKITFSNTAKKLTEYDTLNIKLRYNERICYLDLIGLRHPPKPGTANEIFLDHASGITILLSTAMVPQDVATAIEGSGGNYFSNEIFYRVSNLVQSVQAASSSGIKNGHIHIPDLGAYESVASATLLGTVTLADLVTSVLAVLDGVSDP
jgi:hypothetical protein